MRYGFAVLAVALALLLKLLLDPLIEQETPFLLVLAAVAVSAWFGGLGPGLLATVVAALAVDYFFLPPFNSFSVPGLKAVPLGLFILEGILVSVIVTALRSARSRAEVSVLEARRHQQGLRRSEERFRLLVEGVKDYAIFMLDPEGYIVSWNEGAERIKGYTAEEIVGEHFSRFYTQEDVERGHLEEELRIAAAEGRYEEEGLRVRKDGSLFWASVLITALRDEAGNLRGFAKVTRDVTERKRAEKVLKESEARKTAIMEAALDCIITMDHAGMITDFNPAAERTFGYRRAEVLGRELAETIIPLSLRDSHRRGLAHYLATGEGPVLNRRIELPGMRADGTEFPVELTVIPVRLAEQPMFVSYLRDITERKRAEQRLRDTLDKLLTLYETGQILSSSLKREEIGARLLEAMQRASELSAAVIELHDDGEQWRVLRTIGPENLWSWARSTPEARSARRAALETEEHRSFELRPSGPKETRLWGLCLPLLVRERLAGVLEAYGPQALTEQETTETLVSLANQAASALENARLYEELAEREHRLRELVGRMLVAQEEERRRVAYEVHDGLAQVAAAAHQHLQGFAKRHPPGTTRGREELDEALKLIQQAVREARHVIANLRPTALDDFGLAIALRLRVEELSTEGLQVSYEETLGDKRLPVTVETALYRVAQEALTNVRKHAQSSRVHLKLERLDRTVRLEVRDWGRGFEADEVKDGGGPGERVGLSSMHERVALLGGDLRVHSQPGAGTSVVAEVPLPEEETNRE